MADIGRQGDGLHDLSESLETRVSSLPCGLPHPSRSHGSGQDVSKVPCPLGSRLQNFTVFSTFEGTARGRSREGGDRAWGRPEGQELSEHFFPRALPPIHVAQLYPPLHSSSSIPHPSFPQRHFLALEHPSLHSSSQCLHLSPLPYQPGRSCFSDPAFSSLALL